jgi:hypothetical protein
MLLLRRNRLGDSGQTGAASAGSGLISGDVKA